MRYYIKDSTIKKVVYFNNLNEVVSYFGQMIPRAFNKTKQQYIQYLAELGHGYDDDGVVLTRALSEQFNIGVERKNGKLERTDIHEASKFQKNEYGD